MMAEALSSSAQRVQDALKSLGFSYDVLELPGSTRTSIEAAQAIGCRVEQIAKSIVFQGKRTGRSILVIASGTNRVNDKKLRKLVDEPVRIGDADFVREQTGFAIGGVPPVGHVKEPEIFIDEDLLQYDEIWAAAGTPHAVFKFSPGELQKLTGGCVASIA